MILNSQRSIDESWIFNDVSSERDQKSFVRVSREKNFSEEIVF